MASQSTGVTTGTVTPVSSTKSSNSSSSTPGLLNSDTSNWEYQLSQVLGALGEYQYNWAQNTYNTTSAITDQQINNYLTTAQTGSSMANNLLGRYQSIFQPLEDQYVQEAGSYASQARINFNMGAAQSKSEQASEAGLKNSEQTLQSYGIDPSSGRYQDLIASQKTAAAAAAAGAGQQAELATEQTGRTMRQNAIAMGQQIPGQTVNALNSAYQGIAGAENSALGRANVGATLTDSANPYFSSAMQAKLPSVGNTSSSSGSTNGSSSGASGGGGGAGQIHDPDQGGGGGQNNGSGSRSSGGTYTQGGSTPFSNSGNIHGKASEAGASEDGGVMPQYYDPSYSTDTSVNDAATNYLNDPTAGANSAGQYQMGGGGNYAGYDQGGGVLPGGNGQPQGGGHVPASMSPSGGQQTDDIPGVIPQTGGQARLNADEFVIPKDVAMWKGQEFFQKLIEGSRKARMGAPAKPSTSQPMQQGAQ